MKRSALLLAGLALAFAGTANAQLTMQMSNGWSFSFAGNVNAFIIYQNAQACAYDPTAPDKCATAGKDLGFGTGLLPAFATFEAKGKEGSTDLGVHFGFAPQIQFGGHNASYFGTDAAGAQIDMRQVYLTAGGTWGQLLMGKELGLFQRGNILNDMTLLGVGVGGAGRGTALGRIGYGYLYTDFRPQLTYSTVSGKPFQLSIGVFDPIRVHDYTVAEIPRLESELTYSKSGEKTNFKFWVNGAVGTMKDGVASDFTGITTTHSLTSTGVGGGAQIDFSGLSIMGSGFYANGMGWLLQGDGIVGGQDFYNGGVSDVADASGKFNGRASYGFIGQATYSPKKAKWMLGFSWGENHLKQESTEDAAWAPNSPEIGKEVLKTRAYIGQITYKWTKSLRWVAEYGHIEGYDYGVKSSKSDQGSLGMMLFF